MVEVHVTPNSKVWFNVTNPTFGDKKVMAAESPEHVLGHGEKMVVSLMVMNPMRSNP